MKAKVEVSFTDKRKPQQMELLLKVKGKPGGMRLMNAIDKAVIAAMAKDPSWKRWSLIDIIE